MHLHQKLPPALLDQLRSRRTLTHLHPHLRIDVHEEETIPVENLLRLPHGRSCIRELRQVRERLLVLGKKRRTEIVSRLNQAPHLRKEGLRLDAFNHRCFHAVRDGEQKRRERDDASERKTTHRTGAETEGNYDIDATMHGGGISGQAGALRMAIARSLVELDPEARAALKKAGLLTRDPRRKESKKYGLKKARKAPQYTKR